MEKYNLDEKGGLFKSVIKSPSKIVKQGDAIDFKHFGMLNYVKAKVTEVTDTSIRIQSSEKAVDVGISPGDHIVLYYASGDVYAITAEMGTVNKVDPIDVTVKVVKIEKLKELIKEKRYPISMHASFKIIGVPETKFAAVKVISFGGVKADCKEDIMLEDIVEVILYYDKMNKINFKGRIVRKNSIGSVFEYGIEYTEITETNNKLVTRLVYDIEGRV